MQFDYWVCDICGRKFGDIDAGYLNCHPIYIELKDTPYGFNDLISYKDTCIICRSKISRGINSVIANIQKDR